MRANAGTALRLFEAAARQLRGQGPHYMGLDVFALLEHARTISRPRQTPRMDLAIENALSFDLMLWPQ